MDEFSRIHTNMYDSANNKLYFSIYVDKCKFEPNLSSPLQP